MRKLTIRRRLMASSMICGISLLAMSAASVANAETDAAANASDEPVQEIVVTGSLIKSPNIKSDSPVTAISSQDLKLEGTTTVENLLNQLPQVTGGQNLGQSINSTGTATISLRGLGANRTLVLVDGRRLQPGDPTVPYADLNDIPAAMVDRVDILTGGASSTYGADAVAGVVNFVMKKNFSGIQLDIQASGNQNDAHSKTQDAVLQKAGNAVPGNITLDGQQYTASVIMGVNAPDDKGNITVYGSYFHSDPVLQSTRDYSACSEGSTYTTNSSAYNVHNCIGSSNSAYGRFQALTNPGVTNPANTKSKFHDNPDGTNTFVTSSVPGYNFNNQSYLQRQDDRYNFGYFAHYQLAPKIDLYSDFMFTEDNTLAQYAPSGFFAGTGPVLRQSYFNINCNNPYLSAQQALALCGTQGAGTAADARAQIGYRFASADRSGTFNHTSYKVDIGARGDLDAAWSYDAYLQYGTSRFEQVTGGYASLSRLQNGLLVNPDGTCISGGQCVPINIFQANSKGISQAAFNYVLTPGFQSGETVEQIADITLNGDLGKYGWRSPFAQDGADVALGTQYRRESLVFQTDAEFSSGDLSGGNQAIGDSGSFDVYEVFGEAHVPLVQDKPFIKSLNFNPGYRFSDYSSVGQTDTYKLDFDYAPTDDIRFRYSYNVAVRAPNINELYAPQVQGLFTGQDPCAGAKPSASAAACAAQGVTAAEYGNVSACPASQCSSLVGGNKNLQPETAYTYTYGFVLTPRFLPHFTLSVDYYNIRIDNVISAGLGGANAQLTGCVLSSTPLLCNTIHRDPSTGEVFGNGYVATTNVNDGFLQTKGIDFAASYMQKLGQLGRLDFTFNGTYTDHYVVEAYAGSGTYDCASLYGVTCGQPTPTWRHTARVTWTTPWKLTSSIQWRYIGSTSADTNQSNPLLNAYPGLTDVVDGKIPDISYFDLSFQYQVKDGYVLRAGVNNLFDRSPPFGDANNLGYYASGNGNTFPGLYDTLGRNIYVGLTANF